MLQCQLEPDERSSRFRKHLQYVSHIPGRPWRPGSLTGGPGDLTQGPERRPPRHINPWQPHSDGV